MQEAHDGVFVLKRTGLDDRARENFDEAAAESYQESQETFSKLFEDQEKYVAIMTAIGEMLFAERKNAG